MSAAAQAYTDDITHVTGVTLSPAGVVLGRSQSWSGYIDGRYRLCANYTDSSARYGNPMAECHRPVPGDPGRNQIEVYDPANNTYAIGGMPGLGVTFHTLPKLSRDDIVLAGGVLERIERHTIGMATHQAALLAGRRHLKRGLLLHGPPGTGKTLTVMYLLSQMPERTTLLLSGRGLAGVGASCALARQLQPATVVLEDVDLVAEDRGHYARSNPLLFELLDEMDGLADDADVIFLLTTNRADLLEPALAARPGRVDQAVDVALPDPDCRRRLLDLYAQGLTLEVDDWTPVVDATEGVSASFIKELLREAALVSAEEGAAMVSAAHVQAALTELTIAGGALTAALLGAGAPARPRQPSRPAAARSDHRDSRCEQPDHHPWPWLRLSEGKHGKP